MVALIDIGNTKVKVKIYDLIKERFINDYSFLTEDLLKNKIKIAIDEKVEKVIYSSVIKKFNELIKIYFNVECIEIKELKINGQNIYTNINNIGSDIIANFYGSLDYKLKSYLIISLGTATTISIVENGKLKDCLLCPGLLTSFEGMAKKINGFNIDTNIENYDNLKNDNLKALYNGLIKGHKHMVYGFINEYGYENVIMTGGYLKYFKNEFNEKNILKDEDLIFKGIKNLAFKK